MRLNRRPKALSMPAKHSRASLGFILLTVFLDFVGIGLIIPVLPKLVGEILSLQSGSETAVTPDEVAAIYGWLVASYAITQFLCAPFVGALSDRFGRRPILLISIAGFAIDFLIAAFATNLVWLFAARLLSGATAANITAVNAYIADVSKPEDRVKGFGFVGATIGLGFIFGPGLGGLLGEYGVRVPFFAAAGLAGLNFLYGLFVLPESLAVENRKPVSFAGMNPLSTLGLLRRDGVIFGLAVALFAAALADQSLRTTWVLFTDAKFGWGTRADGIALSTVGICMAFVQGGLASRITKRIGERSALLFGLLSTTVAFTAYAFVPSGWMLYPAFILGSLGGLAGPSNQSIITRRVPADEQGAVQGALASLISLAAIVGPPLASLLFAATTAPELTTTFPGSPLVAGAFLYLLAAVISFAVTRGVTDSTDRQVSETVATPDEVQKAIV